MHRLSYAALTIAALLAAPLHAEGTEAQTSRKLRAQVDQYAGQCQLDAAYPLLARLATLAENYRANIGGSGARAEMARDGQAQLEGAQAAYANARVDCARKPRDTGAADPISPPKTSQPEDGSTGAPALTPAPYAPLSAGASPGAATAAEPHATSPASIAASKRFARLLGRWTSRKYGGVIETWLEADGTLTGVIVATNKPMLDHGYSAGMTVLRGYRPRMMTNTWLMAAQNGQTFSAKQPDRVAGEPFGTAAWNKGSVIYIHIDHQNRLGLPADIENRLSNYDPWVRQ